MIDIGRDIPLPQDSPWGEIDNIYEINNGIFDVTTASHGGIMIDNALASLILSDEAMKIGEHYGSFLTFEEDCESSVAYRELLDKKNVC